MRHKNELELQRKGREKHVSPLMIVHTKYAINLHFAKKKQVDSGKKKEQTLDQKNKNCCWRECQPNKWLKIVLS